MKGGRWQAKDVCKETVLRSIGDGIGEWHLRSGLDIYPWKVLLRVYERLEDAGLVECGVGPGWPWLTDAGRDALDAAQGDEA